jgi:threonine aldolase
MGVMDDVTEEPLSLLERARRAQAGVTRSLQGRLPLTPEQELRELAAVAASFDDPGAWDRYGERGPVARLEEEVASLLGKPAAAFFPSGVMAQQAILRVWCDEQGSSRVALPELSHLLHHEEDGPRLLHGLELEPLTVGAKVPQVADLAAISGRLGAVLLELPLRDAGYLLPTWDELVAFAEACEARETPLHLDGARLWESAPHLGHTPAEIAALADSVYVSFYKGLGGLAGAVVAGPEEQVEQARTWRTRMGGTLFTLMPYAVAALRGLEVELPRMVEFHHRARELAERMEARGIRVHPSPPHTNAFRLFVEQDADVLSERLVHVMQEEQLALTPLWHPSEVPGWAWTEFTVGPATMEWDVDDAVETLARTVLD